MKRSNRPTPDHLRRRAEALQRAIAATDLVASGTLRTRTKVCGRPNCRCAKDVNARHGPYHEWQRYRDQHLVLRVVSSEEAEIIQAAINNYRQIQRLLQSWDNESAEAILGKKRAKP